MKRILLIALLALSAQPVVSQQAVPTAIQGTVSRLGTEEPLAKVTVELKGAARPLTTITERDGQFYFPNLGPGEYRLTAKRDGFVPAEWGQQWLNGPGQPITIVGGRPVAVRMWMRSKSTRL